jgi:hypothetical protein
MNIEALKRELVETLTQPPVTLPASAFGLYGINKDRVAKLCSELLKQDTLSLSFPKELLQSYQDRDEDKIRGKVVPLTQATTTDYSYRRYGGLGIFSYVEITAIPDGSTGVTVVEALPHKIDYTEEEEKLKSWQVYDSFPFILRAIVDHARLYQIQGIHLTLNNFRYHPIDYRDYAYYICTRKCLDKLFEIHK